MSYTNELLDKVIMDKVFTRLGNKTIVCCLILKNGYEIIGSSCPGKLEAFNEESGRLIAFNRACDALEDYLRICEGAKNLGATEIFDFMEDK